LQQTDADAWKLYPHHRWLFNKLELALRLGYNAGPGGVGVHKYGDYIIRPIYNLSGMGVNARRQQLTPGDTNTVKPGEFWCDYFHGPHISIDYEWQDIHGDIGLIPVFATQGFRTGPDLYRFNCWKVIEPPLLKLPSWIGGLLDVPRFNIEFIHDQIIEIHLRGGNDFPPGATEIIPIWSDMSDSENNWFLRHGFALHPSLDDADGHLPVGRLGFFYK
jgi:hypothetical protein